MTGRTYSISDATVTHGNVTLATGTECVLIIVDAGDRTPDEKIDIRELFTAAVKEFKDVVDFRPLCNAFDWRKRRARERWHESPVVAWIARALTHGQK